MAAFIKSTPASPLMVFTPSILETTKAEISWGTGNADLNAGLFVSTDNGPFTRLGAPETDNVGAKSGKATLVAHLGDVYVLRLVSFEAKKRVLSETIIRTQEQVKLKIIGAIRSKLLDRQAIYGVHIEPGPESVRVRFRTRRPTIPFIDVKIAETLDPVTFVFAPARASQTSHDYQIPLGEGPTRQNQVFRLHIFAPSLEEAPSAEVTALFRTGSRRVEVFFDHLFVQNDGDPGLLGDGDFHFQFGAGRIGEGEGPFDTGTFNGGIGTGEDRSLNIFVAQDTAPAGIWVQAQAREDDAFGSVFDAEFVGFAPEGVNHFQSDDSEYVVITKWFDLSGFEGPIDEIPFTLESGPLHVSYTVNCRLRVETNPGAVIQPQIVKRGLVSQAAHPVAYLGALDRVATNRSALLQRSPNGEIFLGERAAGAAPRRWSRFTEPTTGTVTVVELDGGPQLFALDDNGEAKALDAHTGTWRSLGRGFVDRVLAVADPGGPILFALDCEGGISRRHGESGWERIADGVSADLNLLETDGRVGLVARGLGGEILYRQSAVDDGWTRLEGPQGQLLAAATDDGGVAFAVLREDETLVIALSDSTPERLNWREAGDITAMLDRGFSLAGIAGARSSS